MDGSDDQPPEAGKRPRDGRFVKGQSGNRRGRPRKDVRPITSRQVRKDLIEMLEEPVEIRVGGKPKTVPLIVAHTRAQMHASAQGKGKVDLAPLLFYAQLVGEHERANPRIHLPLDAAEQETAREGGLANLPREFREIVKELRQKSRNL